MSEFTYLKYSGSDAQILALINKLLQSHGDIPQIHDPAPPEAESATPDEPEESKKLRAIALRFSRLLDQAEASGSPGQKKAMKRWLLQDGKAEINDLATASGVKDAKRYAPIGGALTRNMKKAGGPPQSCIGVPTYPISWYGWIKNPANGNFEYIIAETLLPYLKAAFEIVN